jgi:hypothetical protein
MGGGLGDNTGKGSEQWCWGGGPGGGLYLVLCAPHPSKYLVGA